MKRLRTVRWGFFCLLMWTSVAFGQSNDRPAVMLGPRNPFESALADDVPSSQARTYQHVGARDVSPSIHGLQFATPGAQVATGSHGSSLTDSSIWGTEGIRQIQYPLSDERYDDPELTQPGSPRQPSIHCTSPATACEPDGIQCQFLGDVTQVFGSGDTLGITTLTSRLIVESPRLPGVSFRPHFGWHFLHGPESTDLPGQLYDFSLEARMYWPFHDRLIGEFALAPSVFSDFQNMSSDAIRIVGRAVGYFIWSPDVKVAAGATYLDRQDILVLPIAGVIWTPSPDYRLDLLFPQPRIAYRYSCDTTHERWVYVSGELGGGSWAIERSNGQDDVVSYRDLRLIMGVEWKYHDKSSWRLEAGYVFGRELEYVSRIGDYDPDATSMIRAALVY